MYSACRCQDHSMFAMAPEPSRVGLPRQTISVPEAMVSAVSARRTQHQLVHDRVRVPEMGEGGGHSYAAKSPVTSIVGKGMRCERTIQPVTKPRCYVPQNRAAGGAGSRGG